MKTKLEKRVSRKVKNSLKFQLGVLKFPFNVSPLCFKVSKTATKLKAQMNCFDCNFSICSAMSCVAFALRHFEDEFTFAKSLRDLSFFLCVGGSEL